MKLGKVLTYKDIDEAKRLIRKRVVASDILYGAESDEDWGVLRDEKIYLSKVIEGNPFPFRVSNGTVYQFIREVLPDKLEYEPYDLSDPKTFDIEVVGHYEPYDLSDPKVRDSLRGRWIIYAKGDEYTTEEVIIVGFGKQGKDYWKVMIGSGEISATELLEYYIFDDGTPCGRRMDKEMSSPVLTRDGKEDEK